MKELLIERFKKFPIKQGTKWQGIRLRPGWMNNDDNESFCPHMMLWAELPAHYILNAPKLYHARPSHQDILNELLQSIGQTGTKVTHRPSLIEVKDKDVAEFLRIKFEPIDIRCEYKSSLPEIERVAKSMLCSMGANDSDDHSLANDDFFEITRMTENQMASFYDASKTLYIAEPWQYFTDSDLIKVEYKSKDRTKYPQAFVVMGSGGMEFGLSFFETPEHYFDMVMQSTLKKETLPSMSMWALNYGSITDLQNPELEAWEKYKWSVADEYAFPMILNYIAKKRAYTLQRSNLKQQAYFETVIRFLAENTKSLRKKGKISGTVSTSFGNKEISFQLEKAF